MAIDWEFVGHGALGEDAAGLVMGNLLFFGAAGNTPRDLDATCFAAYVEGLRAVGWDGDMRAVRLRYAAAAVLRYVGVAPGAAVGLGDPAGHPVMAQLFGRPVPEVVAAWEDALWPFLLALAEEARGLLRAAG